MITFKAKNSAGEIINSALSPFTFPAGEAHIKREDRRELESIEIAVIQPSAESIHTDLFHLAMWNDYINHTSNTVRHRVLVLPYFPGARADRDRPWGAMVYAEFINKLNLTQVIVFDPHSEVCIDLLDKSLNITVLKPADIIKARMLQSDYTAVIAPDKGAIKRASEVAEKLGVPMYTAEKTRDFETGKLTGYSLDLPEESDEDDEFLVVDDICDGGGTFALLSEAIHKQRGHVGVDLFVSHGVFSKKALSILETGYDMVYTTNSYFDHNPCGAGANVTRFDVIRPLLERI